MNNFYSKYVAGKERRWFWYIALLIGVLPCIIRFFVWMDADINGFDIKDLLFAGLSLNLANLTQLSNSRFPHKELMATFSLILVAIICSFLGVFLKSEAPLGEEPKFLFWASFLPFLGSVYLNYETHTFE